jgi:Icc protein
MTIYSRDRSVTDPHLEFLQEDSFMRAGFLRELFNGEADAVLITGDVSNATNLEMDLDRLAQLNKSVYFVLGNHDFYGGTFAASTEITTIAVRRSRATAITQRRG